MDKEKLKRIKAERKRLDGQFQAIPDNQFIVCDGLLDQAAFMRIVLEDLQNKINDEGYTDDYQNGNNQFGRKQSADLQSYNQTLKSYSVVMKQLMSYLPPAEAKKVSLQEKLSELVG